MPSLLARGGGARVHADQRSYGLASIPGSKPRRARYNDMGKGSAADDMGT